MTVESTIDAQVQGTGVGAVVWKITQSFDGDAENHIDAATLVSIRRGVADADAGRVKTWDEVRATRVEV